MIVGYELLGVPGHGAIEGQGQYAFRLLKAMLALDSGCRFAVFYNSCRKRLPKKTADDALGSDNFDWLHTRIPCTDRFRSATAIKYHVWTARAKGLGIDLFHGTSFRGMVCAHPPSVITVHDLAAAFFPQTVWRDRNIGGLIREIGRARGIVVPSNHTRRDLLTFFQTPPEKVTVVPEGFNGPATEPGSLPPGLPERFALYVGSYRHNKNVGRLIDAFALVAGRMPGAGLVLVGPRGDLAGELAQRAQQHGVADRVRFTGYLPPAQLEACYARALCLVQPSVYEGFGLTPLEAMGRGVPVAVANNTSMPEVVGGAGLTFDPLDTAAISHTIHRLMTHETLRASLSVKGSQRAAELTWKAAAKRTLAVYVSCRHPNNSEETGHVETDPATGAKVSA